MTAVLELLTGLEPVASSLPRKCSTTELQQQAPLSALMARKEKAFSLTRKLGSDVVALWSGRWESNPRVQLGRLSFYH
jgi:hypothetical protein